MIKKIMWALLVVSVVGLAGCGDDSGSSGDSGSKYRSCKISSAPLSGWTSAVPFNDRITATREAEAQCWSLPGSGYSDQNKAMDWCRGQARNFLSGRYNGSFGVRISSVKCGG